MFKLTNLLIGTFLYLQFAHADEHILRDSIVSKAIQATNGDSTGLAPVNLGKPVDCRSIVPYAMNNGAFPDSLTITGGSNCFEANFPVTWHKGSWLRYTYPIVWPGVWGEVASISDGPPEEAISIYVVNEDFWDEVWVGTGEQPLIELGSWDDGTHASSAVVSSEGKHIAATTKNFFWPIVPRATRWTRSSDGWSLTDQIGPGFTSAITADGGMVVGVDTYEHGTPWVWTATQGGGDLVWLDSNAAAYDVSHDGSIIVGIREQHYSIGTLTYFTVPVYWVRKDGKWILHDLQTPDWLATDSPGYAVAVAKIGSQSIIVGNFYSDYRNVDAQAVAWIPGTDGSYGAPISLQTLSGSPTSEARVIDINSSGVALGRSSDGDEYLDSVAVIWQVVEPPRFSINAGLNGFWWKGPDRSGEGVQLEVSAGSGDGSVLAVSVFSYDPHGHQIFLVAVGAVNGETSEVQVFITTGGLWGDDFDPALVKQNLWGAGTFSSDSCDLIHMELRPNTEYQSLGYTNLAYELVRLTKPLLPCPIVNPN